MNDSDANDIIVVVTNDKMMLIIWLGTADGGHYYAFIRDRTSVKDKW